MIDLDGGERKEPAVEKPISTTQQPPVVVADEPTPAGPTPAPPSILSQPTAPPPPTSDPPPSALPPLAKIIAPLFSALRCTTPHSHRPAFDRVHVVQSDRHSEKTRSRVSFDVSSDDEDEAENAIESLLRDPVTLPCGHTACADCLGIRGTVATAGEVRAIEPAPANTRPGGALSGLMGVVRRASSSSSSLPLPTPTASAGGPAGGLFAGSSARRRSNTVEKIVVCPVAKCETRIRSTSAPVTELALDVGLQKILMLIRREWPALFPSPSTTAAGGGRDAWKDRRRMTRSSESGSSTADQADEDGKRGHKPRPTSDKRSRVDSAPAEQSLEGPFASLNLLASDHPSFVGDLASELECQVCTLIYHEPVTTPCGHTFCKSCLLRSLDHSDKCPLCRCDLPGFAHFSDHAPNATVVTLVSQLFGELYRDRVEAARVEAEGTDPAMTTPIFVCTLAFPNMPTFLHVFEPRYRLMMRRAMAADRRFGMVLPSRSNGGVHEYGTMLEIRNMQLLPDGRSMVETVGVARFKVLDHGTLDGYSVARTEPIDDIPESEERELERVALERIGGGGPEEQSTEELMRTCRDFVEVLRSGSTPWILQRLNVRPLFPRRLNVGLTNVSRRIRLGRCRRARPTFRTGWP